MGGQIKRQMVLVAIFMSFTSSLFSQEQIKVQTSVFQAGDRNYELAEIKAFSNQGFVPLAEIGSDQGFTNEYFWLKLKLENPGNQSFNGLLSTGRPITDEAILYDGEKQMRSGDLVPFKDRAYAHRLTSFPISLTAGESKVLYLKLKSDGETLDINPRLQSAEAFAFEQYNQQLFLGLFYGMLCISALIYLFFYTSLQEQSFLFYVVYIGSIALLQASLDGLIYQYILPNGGFLGSRIVLITASLSNFFLLKYCASFLKVEDRSPKLYRFYKLFYLLIPACASLLFINDATLNLAYPICNIVGLFSLGLILSSVIHTHRKLQKVDPFFRLGILFLLLGLLAFILNNLGLLPNYFWVKNSAKVGIGIEVVFLSLSMTNLIGKLRQAKEQSQNEALKNAKEVSAFKSYFMSNISHELRTPINAILGISSGELDESKLSNADRENYRIIKSAAHNLLSNVNDILDFEQIEKNELELNMDQKFNPREALEDLCDSWLFEANKKDVKLNWAIGERLPECVRGDEKRFSQIINHLLSNAVKFTESGQINVAFHGQEEQDGKASLRLSISDTGVGMTEKERLEIFESFNQMKRDNKRRHGGLGLGLTIVKHLVGLFNANLKVESEQGFGTTVRLFINLEVAEQEQKAISKEEMFEDIVENTPAETNQIKILVAEDNLMNQMIMKKILGDQSNISLEMANDGALALKAMEANKFDLILMDLQMPNMDGYEACEAIRGGAIGQEQSEIPIIAVTADATQETRKRVFEIGMNAYLTKPVRKEQLLEKIYELARTMKVAV